MVYHHLEPVIRQVNGIMDELRSTDPERKQIFDKNDQSDLSMDQLEAVARISALFSEKVFEYGLSEEEMDYIGQECSKEAGE